MVDKLRMAVFLHSLKKRKLNTRSNLSSRKIGRKMLILFIAKPYLPNLSSLYSNVSQEVFEG